MRPILTVIGQRKNSISTQSHMNGFDNRPLPLRFLSRPVFNKISAGEIRKKSCYFAIPVCLYLSHYSLPAPPASILTVPPPLLLNRIPTLICFEETGWRARSSEYKQREAKKANSLSTTCTRKPSTKPRDSITEVLLEAAAARSYARNHAALSKELWARCKSQT